MVGWRLHGGRQRKRCGLKRVGAQLANVYSPRRFADNNALERATYVVIPSRIESIPVVLSDALQRGRPVVTMPVGDLGELFAETGCGLVADTASAAALARALTTALATDSSGFSAGVAKAAKQFDIAATAQRWLNSDATDDEETKETSRARDAGCVTESTNIQ